MLTNGDNPLPSQTARAHLDVDVISTSDQLKPAYNIGMLSVTTSLKVFLFIKKITLNDEADIHELQKLTLLLNKKPFNE